MARVLIIGDIMGKPGRQALAQVLPLWKQGHRPDVIIGNVENLTHGKGITPAHIQDMVDLGFDVFTSGNHVFDSGPRAVECFEKFHNIVRPANYETLSPEVNQVPGPGHYRFSKNGQQYLVINLGGQVFFDKQYRGGISNPFTKFDAIYNQEAQKDDIIIVDLHAEATSEKNVMGWHSDGRATIVYGTHTHIPTADTKVLPKGTAFQTDIGMTGARDSVLGVKVQNAAAPYVTGEKFRMEIPEEGPAIVNGLLVEVDDGNAVKVERLQTQVEI